VVSKQLVIHKQLVVQLLQLDTSNFQNGGRPWLYALGVATLESSYHYIGQLEGDYLVLTGKILTLN
jgi:hypothetical protein